MSWLIRSEEWWAPQLDGSITSHHITSHAVTSHHITSHHMPSLHITSLHMPSHVVTSHHITSYAVTSHHITSHAVISHNISSHHITCRHIISHRMPSHHITSHHMGLGLRGPGLLWWTTRAARVEINVGPISDWICQFTAWGLLLFGFVCLLLADGMMFGEGDLLLLFVMLLCGFVWRYALESCLLLLLLTWVQQHLGGLGSEFGRCWLEACSSK